MRPERDDIYAAALGSIAFNQGRAYRIAPKLSEGDLLEIIRLQRSMHSSKRERKMPRGDDWAPASAIRYRQSRRVVNSAARWDCGSFPFFSKDRSNRKESVVNDMRALKTVLEKMSPTNEEKSLAVKAIERIARVVE